MLWEAFYPVGLMGLMGISTLKTNLDTMAPNLVGTDRGTCFGIAKSS